MAGTAAGGDPAQGFFRVQKSFQRFWIARVISLIGDGAGSITLLLLVSAQHPGSKGVAAVLLAESVPRFFGPFAGAAVDRFDKRVVLIVCELGQAAVFMVIVADRPGLVTLTVLVAVAASFGTVFSAAGRSVVPQLVAESQLMRANAWLGSAFNLQAALGPVLGGVLTIGVGTRGALAFDAVSFVIAAVVMVGVHLRPATPRGDADGEDGPEGLLQETVAGLRFLAEQPIARAVVSLLGFGIFFASFDNVALIFLARDALHSGPLGFSILATSFGIAMVVASLVLVQRAEKVRPSIVFLGGWIATGAGLALTAGAPVLIAAVAVQAIAGLGNGLANVGEDTLLQQSVPEHMLGRVGGTVSSIAFLGSSAAYVIGGVTVATLGSRVTFLIAGLGTLAVCALTARRLLGVTLEAPPVSTPPDDRTAALPIDLEI